MFSFMMSDNRLLHSTNEEQKLTDTTGVIGDRMGMSVSVFGDTCAVGIADDDENGLSSGSVIIFTRSGNTWTQQQKILALDGVAGDLFGTSVSLYQDTCVIGAVGVDDVGAQAGAAYIFTRSGTTWTQQQKITGSSPSATDTFGYSVSVYQDTCIIGAPSQSAGTDLGSAYAFTRLGTTWTEEQKITGSDTALGDQFGRCVSINQDTCVVGAYQKDGANSSSGGAYVFTRSGTTWTEEQILVNSVDSVSGDRFGQSVSVFGDDCIVGAPNTASGGIVYTFTRSGTTWTEQDQILGLVSYAGNDNFGDSISLTDGVFVAGGTGLEAGIFTRVNSVWEPFLIQSLVPSNSFGGADTNKNGNAVSIHNGTCIVGAARDDDEAPDAGAAFIFRATDS